MKRVNMHDAKPIYRANGSRLKGKESLILCNRNRPVAELRPLPAKAGKPRIGVANGEFVVPEAFLSLYRMRF